MNNMKIPIKFLIQNQLSGYLLCAIFIFSACPPGCSQEVEEKTGAWIMYFGQNRVSNRFSIHSEIQWRNHSISPNLEQLLLRAGLNYHISTDYMLSAGYGYISTHPYDKDNERISATEHRIWEQFIMKNSISRFFFNHRYRYEQRWINGVFRQRLRYRLMLSIPLNKRTIEKGSIILAVYDEIFLSTEKDRVFDRNRLYGAIGYHISRSTSFQAGLLEQSLPDYGKLYLQFALFFNPDFRSDH